MGNRNQEDLSKNGKGRVSKKNENVPTPHVNVHYTLKAYIIKIHS